MTPRSLIRRTRPFVLATALALALALPAGALAAGPDHIVVTVSPSKPAVGQAFTVTAVAKDAANATIGDYSAPASWTDTAGALDTAAPSDFVNGVSTTSAVISKPVSRDAISIAGDGVKGTSALFSVIGPVDHFDVKVPGSVAAGTPFTVTAVARDVVGNQVSAYAGTADVEDTGHALDAPGHASFSGGVSKTAVQASIAARADQIAVKNPDVQGISAKFDILGAVDHFDVSTPSSATTGAPFTLTARARDTAGHLVTSYNAGASWSDKSGQLQLGGSTDFVNGVSSISASEATPYHADVITVTSSGLTGATKAFDVVGPFDHLDARVPASVPLDGTFTLTASARDAANNLIPTYNVEWWAWFSDSDGGSLAPFVGGVSKTTITATAAWGAPRHQTQLLLGGPTTAFTNPIDVVGPVDHFALTWKRTDGLTGCDSVTGSLVAKAIDSAGNFVKSYQDAHPMWGPDPVPPMDPATPAPFVNGVSSNPRVSSSGFRPDLDQLEISMVDASVGSAVQVC